MERLGSSKIINYFNLLLRYYDTNISNLNVFKSK